MSNIESYTHNNKDNSSDSSLSSVTRAETPKQPILNFYVPDDVDASKVRINLQVPDVPLKRFTLSLPSENKTTYFDIPATIDTDFAPYTSQSWEEQEDRVNMLDWIFKKGKYISGDKWYQSINKVTLVTYWSGRYKGIGAIMNAGDNGGYATDTIKNDTIIFSDVVSSFESQYPNGGDSTQFEKDHMQDLKIKEPAVYIKI